MLYSTVLGLPLWRRCTNTDAMGPEKGTSRADQEEAMGVALEAGKKATGIYKVVW
jgi:hypothetical protein